MRWIAAFLALLALLSASPSVQAESDRLEWQVRYQSRTVRIHVIPPPGKPAPWPMAMVLHGASGLGRGHLIWPMADELAKRGVAAAVVRYYDGMSPRLRRKQSVHWFREREKILEHVTHALLARRAVKGPSIGVFGYSLGGFHAVAMAASDRRIAGAVALAGGLSGHLAGDLSRREAAPLLLIHGTADRIVPYRRSRATLAAWQQADRPVHLLSMRRVGHVPHGENRDYAFAEAAEFLALQLGMASEPPLPRPRPAAEPSAQPPPADRFITAADEFGEGR